jgi:uncharacterized protein YndB with AHSA1/START domain
VTPKRHGSAVIEYPSELEIVTTREFDAPIELVFDVLTKPEHVRYWFAPFEDKMTVCSIDLRVGGDYHMVFVTPDGDKAGRDHMTKHDGQESSFDKLEDYLMSLLDKEETP